MKRKPVTRLDYCLYLLVTPINYTFRHFASHCEDFSHDAIYRYLRGERMTARLVWDNVRNQVVTTSAAYLVFDDTVLNKDYSRRIELVRRQYSGNMHGLIRGIHVVYGLYVNPETDDFWLIDYRLYDLGGDRKSKLDHVHDTLIVHHKRLPFQAALMDSWYATKEELMLFIESLQKVYYCPLKSNRQVDDSGGTQSYRRTDALNWSPTECEQGKTIRCVCSGLRCPSTARIGS